MPQSSSTKILSASLWMVMSFGIGRVAQLVAQVFLARLLSPEDFGIWAMVLVFTNFATLFRDVTIAQVLVQRGLDDRQIVNTVYSLGVNVSVTLFLVQVAASLPLASFFTTPVLVPLTIASSFTFLLGAGAGSHTAVLQQQMKFREIAVCDIAASIGRVIAMISCARLGGGVWSFVLGELIFASIDCCMKRVLSHYRFSYCWKLNPVAVSEVRKFILGILVNRLAVQVNTTSDNLIIGRFLGSQALGYYNLAYQLAMLPVYALSQINRVLLPVLARQNSQGKKATLQHSLETYAVLAAPLYAMAWVSAPWLIPAIYGAEWNSAVELFRFILIFAYARGFMSILGAALVALDRMVTDALINSALVPIALVAYYYGVQVDGARGVAIAVAVVMGIGATFWFWMVTCRAINLRIEGLMRPVLLPTLIAGASLGVVVILTQRFSFSHFREIALLASLYIAVLMISPSKVVPMRLFHTWQISQRVNDN